MFILCDWLNTAIEQPVGWAVLAMKRKGWRAREFQGISEAKVGAHSEKAKRWIRFHQKSQQSVVKMQHTLCFELKI